MVKGTRGVWGRQTLEARDGGPLSPIQQINKYVLVETVYLKFDLTNLKYLRLFTSYLIMNTWN